MQGGSTAAGGPAGLRARLAEMIAHPYFERTVISVIVLNAITLGLETSDSIMQSWGGLLHAADRLMLAFFVAELAARMFVAGPRFIRDPWNLFDTVIVAIALVPATGNLSILRALRILRVLRLITVIPSVKRVVGSLLGAIPSMSSIIILLLLINYVFAVMATKLFGERFEENFGTLGASFFTFFQIMTLEGWSGDVVRPVMEVYPWAWAFFVPYIVIATFMVLNLFIGIVVDAMQQQSLEEEREHEGARQVDTERLLAEVAALRAELRLVSAGRPLPPLESLAVDERKT